MREAMINLRMRCPKCGIKSSVKYPVLVVVVGLTEWNHLALHCDCNDGMWDASSKELRQIRAHVGAAWIHTNRRPQL